MYVPLTDFLDELCVCGPQLVREKTARIKSFCLRKEAASELLKTSVTFIAFEKWGRLTLVSAPLMPRV